MVLLTLHIFYIQKWRPQLKYSIYSKDHLGLTLPWQQDEAVICVYVVVVMIVYCGEEKSRWFHFYITLNNPSCFPSPLIYIHTQLNT